MSGREAEASRPFIIRTSNRSIEVAEIPGADFTSGGLLDRVKGKAKQVLGSRNSRLGKLAAEQKLKNTQAARKA